MKRVFLRINRTWGRDRPMAVRMRREGVEEPRLVHAISVSADYTRMVIETSADPDAFERVLERTEAVTDHEIVPGEDRLFAFFEEETRALEAAMQQFLDELGLVVVPPMEYANRTIGVELAGKTAAIRRAIELFPPDLEYEIERFGDYRRGDSGHDLLTDRQREAVATAIDAGYYDVPRGGGVRDVADRLDCAPSTASNLLRRAEGTVMRDSLAERHRR